MLDHISKAVQYSRDHRAQFASLLEEFVRIPSISTDDDYAKDMGHAADWLSTQLQAIGCEDIQIIPTPGHSVVYAKTADIGPDKPTVLIYGHYDVQPAENLTKWSTPPFSPRIQEECFYGRGASDMKGQIVAVLAALQSIQSQGPYLLHNHHLLIWMESIHSISNPSSFN